MKNKIIFKIIIVLTIVLILTGVTYAVFNYNMSGNNKELIVGDIYIHYEESNQLILENAIPTNIENYRIYKVNEVMKTQSLNELGSCIDFYRNQNYLFNEDAIYAEKFCQGKWLLDGWKTIQDDLDEWVNNDNDFLVNGGRYLLDAGVILQDGENYVVNEVMKTQTLNELGYCVAYYYDARDRFSEGTPVDFCQGRGTLEFDTIQEYVDNSFKYNNSKQLIENYKKRRIIIPETIEKKIYRLNENMTQEELNKCVTIFQDEWGWGKEDYESWENFCEGTGTVYGNSIHNYLNNKLFYIDESNYLEENNIIIPKLIYKLPYFEFTISGKNTNKKEDIWYDIVLNYGDNHTTRTTRIRDDLLRFSLYEIRDNKEYLVIDNLNYSNLDNKRIYTEMIPKNTKDEISKTYRLYMLIDENTVIGNQNQDYTLEEWNNVYASIKVNVTGDFSKNEIITDENCFETESAKVYMLNKDMNASEISLCATYLENKWEFESLNEGESFTEFCQGTGTYQGYSFEEVFYNNWFHDNELEYLEENNVVNSIEGVNITGYNENCGTNLVIPEKINNLDVLKIDVEAFYGSNLTSVKLPNTVRFIGRNAFDLNNITNLELSNNLKLIDSWAFAHNNFSSVTIPDSVIRYYCDSFDADVEIIKNEDLECNPGR